VIPIHKQPAPQSLADYKRKGNTDYETFPHKEDIRVSLVAEQKGICAYCMGRIKTDSIKIEHFKSQSYCRDHNQPERTVDYANMLGCCKGNEGHPLTQQTCDSHKGDKELLYNPANPEDYAKLKIRYLDDGTIKSDDAAFDEQLNSILNLNTAQLKHERRDMIDGAKSALNNKSGSRTKLQIQKLIAKMSRLTDGMYKPYFHAAVGYLEKQLARAE
jgi:uncharacterized protein (TIGR02646 family)